MPEGLVAVNVVWQGKARGRPVWALLGGLINERIRAYTYLYPIPHWEMSPESAADTARKLVDKGYTALKFDPAGMFTMRGGHMPAMRDISHSVNFCQARCTWLCRNDAGAISVRNG